MNNKPNKVTLDRYIQSRHFNTKRITGTFKDYYTVFNSQVCNALHKHDYCPFKIIR